MTEPQQPTVTCYRHGDRPTGVSCSRCGRPICPECMNQASVGFQCPTCVAEARGGSPQARPRPGRGAVLTVRRLGVVTGVLIAVNVAMYVVTAIAAGDLLDNEQSMLFFDLALIPSLVDAGEWWRLLSSAFLHFGLLHIGLNLLNLFILGPDLEGYFGKARFLALYLVSAFGGSVAVLLFSGNVVAAGASGAVFGLLGAALVVLLYRRANAQPIVVVLVLNLILSTLPGISLMAHLGGVVAGAVISAAYVYIPQRMVLAQIGAVAVLVIALVGLVVLRISGAL